MDKVKPRRDGRTRADFLSRMSHELLTPMNAIVGMTRIASASDDMTKIKGCLLKIDEASKQLLGIIRDVTDLTRLEEGRLELVNADFVLEHTLMRVCGEVMAQANEKAQDFQVIIDRDVPQVLRADESRLSQILSNLLMNAVKFTAARGKIRLRVSQSSLGQGRADIAFEVSDTGIGISEAELGRIFLAFEQSDGSSSRVHGGLGLGLTISSQLVRLFGGKINVESELNAGSTFTFNIPAGVVDGASAHTALKSASAGGLNILFVDDSAETRDYFAALMREYGVSCTCAESGFEALSRIEGAESAGSPYTIIFMDWRMPHMSGIETAAQIKRRGGTAGTGPAIVLMAGIEWGVIEQAAAEAGIEHFLQKPLFPSSIIDIINQIVGLPAEYLLAPRQHPAPDDWRAYLPDFDVAQALGRLRGSKQLYAKMLSKLEGNTQFDALRDALAGGDTEKIHALVKSLSPVAKNLCLCDISDILVKIDTMARNRRVPEELADRFEGMRARMFGKLGSLIAALENG